MPYPNTPGWNLSKPRLVCEIIMKRSDGRKPQKLQTDDGKEFYNKTFQTLMKDKDIVHFSTKGDTKASIVERFNRTFKERMYRYFTVHNTLSYLPVLKALAKCYNASYHRSIKMPPNQVNERNEREVWDNLYEKKLNKKPRKPKFKVEETGSGESQQEIHDNSRKVTYQAGQKKCL